MTERRDGMTLEDFSRKVAAGKTAFIMQFVKDEPKETFVTVTGECDAILCAAAGSVIGLAKLVEQESGKHGDKVSAEDTVDVIFELVCRALRKDKGAGK